MSGAEMEGVSRCISTGVIIHEGTSNTFESEDILTSQRAIGNTLDKPIGVVVDLQIG